MDVMIDLETMSSQPTAAIVAIGAVAFNPYGPNLGINDVGLEGFPGCFYRNVDLDSCLHHGLTVSGSTIMWWLKNPKEAQVPLFSPDPIPIDQALMQLDAWLGRIEAGDIWSHATFDVPILQYAYDKVLYRRPPWAYPRARDVRTIQAEAYPGQRLVPGVPTEFPHHALYDAWRQAVLVQICKSKLIGNV